MSEGNIVYNLLRSSDILWADDITGTAQRITLSHVWVRKLISSEAFARIFKPGHTYTLSYSGKVIEPAPDTADTVYRDDRFGVALYTSAGGWSKSFDAQEYLDNPPAGYTFHKSMTFTTPDTYPGDVRLLVYSDYSRDKSGAEHQGIVEIDDLMIVEGSTPAAWAPAEGETVYNLLRSSDILWAGDITGTAQRITLSHVWYPRQLIPSEAFARIFKPGHTYTLSYSGKVIEPAPDTAYRDDYFGVRLYSSTNWRNCFDVREHHDNPPAGYTFRVSKTFTTSDSYPGDVKMYAYSGYSRDESGAEHQGIVEMDDLMIVEGSTPAAWAPAEGETLTADEGGGGMTEPTNLVKTQPDETPATNNTRIWSLLDGTAHDSTTDYHIAVTINPDAQIAAGATGLSIKYTDSSGADNWPRSASIASAIPANAWTRVEGTVTLPAGMTPYAVSIWWPSNATDMHFRACNLTVYPLTGGRIVRARGANDGSKPTGVMTWNGTKGTLKTKEYSVDDVCIIQSDSNLKCINFVFE